MHVFQFIQWFIVLLTLPKIERFVDTLEPDFGKLLYTSGGLSNPI